MSIEKDPLAERLFVVITDAVMRGVTDEGGFNVHNADEHRSFLRAPRRVDGAVRDERTGDGRAQRQDCARDRDERFRFEVRPEQDAEGTIVTTDTLSRVVALVRDVYGTEQPITADTALDALDGDSLGRVLLTIEVEKDFGVRVPRLAEEQWRTVADIVAAVEKARGA